MSYMMFKEEGFYVQKMHSYTNALGRIGTSVYSVEVVPTMYAEECTADFTRIRWFIAKTDDETNGQSPVAGVNICPIARYLDNSLEQF